MSISLTPAVPKPNILAFAYLNLVIRPSAASVTSRTPSPTQAATQQSKENPPISATTLILVVALSVFVAGLALAIRFRETKHGEQG